MECGRWAGKGLGLVLRAIHAGREGRLRPASLPLPALPALSSAPLSLQPHPPASTQVLSPSEAVKIVCDHLAEGYSAAAAASELCREAVRLASSVRHAGEGAQADNTTAAVLAFPEL